jgi:hypothetical protein
MSKLDVITTHKKKNQRKKSRPAELFEPRKHWDENVSGCFF